MGTGGSGGSCNAPGPPQTGDPVPLSLCIRFARKFYYRREPLWISARAELEAFVGVMMLMRQIGPCRGSLVFASDASLSGYGAAQSFWSISDISAVGRIPEVRRWRCGAVPARRQECWVSDRLVQRRSYP